MKVYGNNLLILNEIIVYYNLYKIFTIYQKNYGSN